jgi:hypothetical protein
MSSILRSHGGKLADNTVAPSDISSSLRALALVASRLGVDAGVDQLRRRFALAAGEPDTPTLIALAREIGLEAQALNMKFEDLPRLTGAARHPARQGWRSVNSGGRANGSGPGHGRGHPRPERQR